VKLPHLLLEVGNIHIELIKTLADGRSFRLDPSSLLQPDHEAVVNLDMQCNEVVTSVGGVVVDRNPLVTGTPARQLIGTSLTGVCKKWTPSGWVS